MRWFRELFNSAAKCDRVGHAPRIQWREGFLPPKERGFFSGVADRVRQERRECRRCGQELTPWEVTRCKSIDSLSGPSDMFDAIDNGGYWLNYGRRDPSDV